MVRSSNNTFNEGGKKGHPCLVLDFRGNIFLFPLLSVRLAVILPYMTFIMLNYTSSIPTVLRVFIINLTYDELFDIPFLHH